LAANEKFLILNQKDPAGIRKGILMKKLNKTRRTWIIVLASVLVVGVLIILATAKSREGRGIKVATEKVEKRTIIETVSANGKIQPEKDIKISPYISGEVVALTVKEGDQVSQGQVLAKIDPEIYISNFERMNANLNAQKANQANTQARLAQAEAQYKNAEVSFKRSKQLWEQQVVSDAEFDQATAAFEVAKAEKEAARQSIKSAEFAVESAEASLKEARENLSKTTVTAPSDGTVSKLSVEMGERVTGASQFSPGTEIMRLANLDNMEVNVEVNENDIVRVSLGDTCLIEVDAYLDRKFTGIVTEMATSANVTGLSADQVTNFNVKIRILRESYKDMLEKDTLLRSPFRPGMSATVDIQTETATGLLSIPIQAVTTRTDTTGVVEGEDANIQAAKDRSEIKEVVFVFRDGKAVMTEVTTGIQDNTYIGVIEGLEEGQEVISAPYRAISKRLKNGDAVRKVDKKALYEEEK
jgi:HlyD family secretion protein